MRILKNLFFECFENLEICELQSEKQGVKKPVIFGFFGKTIKKSILPRSIIEKISKHFRYFLIKKNIFKIPMTNGHLVAKK